MKLLGKISRPFPLGVSTWVEKRLKPLWTKCAFNIGESAQQ